jgi:hypothetical protein
MRAFVQWAIQVLRGNWLFLLVVGGIVVAFQALRTPASAVGSAAEMEAMLQRGQPTLVEFYSNT